MQLTSFTDYGLRCLMYLASRPENTCSVREIAEYYNISRNHLVKVVHKLAHGVHQWITCDTLSNKEGLSNSVADYLAAS